jgi:hypothetical protein
MGAAEAAPSISIESKAWAAGAAGIRRFFKGLCHDGYTSKRSLKKKKKTAAKGGRTKIEVHKIRARKLTLPLLAYLSTDRP